MSRDEKVELLRPDEVKLLSVGHGAAFVLLKVDGEVQAGLRIPAGAMDHLSAQWAVWRGVLDSQ